MPKVDERKVCVEGGRGDYCGLFTKFNTLIGCIELQLLLLLLLIFCGFFSRFIHRINRILLSAEADC